MLVKLRPEGWSALFIETSRIIAISIEFSEDHDETPNEEKPWEVSIETTKEHNGFSHNFKTLEDAEAWADQVAKIVNDATQKPLLGDSSDGNVVTDFINWKPTIEQYVRAEEVANRKRTVDDVELLEAGQWLSIWKTVFAESQSQTQETPT